MIRVIKVFTVTIVLLETCWAATDPLEPVQTLAPMKQMRYAPLKGGARYIDERGETPRTEEANIGYENTIIKNFLAAFDKIRRESQDVEVKDAMVLVELLVTQSWIYSMKPTIQVLRGSPNIGAVRTLQDAKDHIIIEISKMNTRKPIADTILFYKKFVEPMVENDFLMQAKMSPDSQANLQKIDEIGLMNEFTKIAFIMCLQSYVRNFVSEPYQATFEIKSSDGKDKMTFKTPSTVEGNFESLVLDADRDYQGFSQFDDRKLQNVAVSSYLNIFEKFIQIPHENDVLDALTIVKILIIQSWVYTMHPATDIVVKFVHTARKEQSLSEIKNELSSIIQQLPQKTVEDAIVRYASSLKDTIGKQLEDEANQLSKKIEAKLSALDGLQEGGDLDEATQKILDRHAELQELIHIHYATQNMCLQSYVLDFFREPYPQTLNLQPFKGKPMSFPTPPLDENSFQKLAQDALPSDEQFYAGK